MTGETLKFENRSKVRDDAVEKLIRAVDRVLADAETRQPWLGWVGLPEDKSGTAAVLKWLRDLKKNQSVMCVLGIGGSCLGAKAVYDFLGADREVAFFDNVDGHSFEKRLAAIDLKKAHFLAISKSGETSETLFQLSHIIQLLNEKRLKPRDHITVITEEKKSKLSDVATSLELRRLPVPVDVGGRFSVFSAVGLAPLMWAGIPVNKLLEGAKAAKKNKRLTAEMAEFYLRSFERQEWISIFWFYVDGLKTFGLWLEQLWAESLAKAKTRAGVAAPRVSTPITCIGATDQHSLLQQFTEGARDKSFLFIRSAQSETSKKIKKLGIAGLEFTGGHSVGELLSIEARATQKILDDLRIPTSTLSIAKNDARSLGALIFLFEMVVATIGESLEINAFDQPGVEAVKKVMLGTLGDARYKDQALNTT
jgi:glucose-6-phosphate isomerase